MGNTETRLYGTLPDEGQSVGVDSGLGREFNSGQSTDNVAREPPPVDEEPPPVDQEPLPVDEEPPPVDQEPPPVDQEPPPVDQEPPPVDQEPPPVDQEPPPVDQEPPPVDQEPPPVDREPPPVDGLQLRPAVAIDETGDQLQSLPVDETGRDQYPSHPLSPLVGISDFRDISSDAEDRSNIRSPRQEISYPTGSSQQLVPLPCTVIPKPIPNDKWGRGQSASGRDGTVTSPCHSEEEADNP